jgi:hypothetical protein
MKSNILYVIFFLYASFFSIHVKYFPLALQVVNKYLVHVYTSFSHYYGVLIPLNHDISPLSRLKLKMLTTRRISPLKRVKFKKINDKPSSEWLTYRNPHGQLKENLFLPLFNNIYF